MGAFPRTSHDHCGPARTEGQRSELIEDVHSGGGRQPESFDGGQLGEPAAFAVDDQHRAGLTGLDGHGRDLHGIDEAEACIAQVEVDALRPEPEAEVDRARHAGLEVVLADRRRNQHVDIGRRHTCQLERMCTRLCRRLVEGDFLGPPTALDDTGHGGEQPGADAAALVRFGQLFIDPGRRYDLRGLCVSHAPDGRSRVLDTGAHLHRIRRMAHAGAPGPVKPAPV